MNSPRRNVLHVVAACLSSVVVLTGAASAQSTIIGGLADWAATPIQSVGDKRFTYLTQSGSWSGTEIFAITSNNSLDSYTVSIDGLGTHPRPFTLSVGYEVQILSGDLFESMSLDVNATGTTTLVTKDIFDSFASFTSGTTPGSGTWSLSLLNSGSGTTVNLSPIQTIWVRDTIAASDSGSLLGISNTIVQLPEPSSLVAFAIGTGCCGLTYWRRRRALRKR